jgi:Ca-activated chloride channel family protein
MAGARVMASLLSLLAAAAALSAGQAPAFRASARMVPLYVTVIGDDGRLVTDLTREDFEVRDNGRRQPITLFDSGEQPISIIVMLDMSGSMLGHISMLRNAAVQMFTRLRPGDRARVGNFGDRIVISPAFTNDVDELIRAVWMDLKPGGATPLWGAVNAAMAGLARVEGRRVVLVLSDGKNSPRVGYGRAAGPSLEDVVRRAQTEDHMVYGIGMRSRGFSPSMNVVTPGPLLPRPGGRPRVGDEPDPGLQVLSQESGGGYFELDPSQDLGAVFARVADELHRQYLVGFPPPESDGALHQLEVRVSDRGMTPKARRSYLAPRAVVDRR